VRRQGSQTLILFNDVRAVSAHPYCARNSLRDVTPRHALSARAVEEMLSYVAVVGT